MQLKLKKFNIKYNIGNVKYIVNYHGGDKIHQDGSPFYDVALFKNKKKMLAFVNELKENGFLLE